MIFRKEKVKDSPTNHFFADIWFLSGDGVTHFNFNSIYPIPIKNMARHIYHLCWKLPLTYFLGKSHPMMLLEAVTLCFAISIAIAEQPTACEVSFLIFRNFAWNHAVFGDVFDFS